MIQTYHLAIHDIKGKKGKKKGEWRIFCAINLLPNNYTSIKNIT